MRTRTVQSGSIRVIDSEGRQRTVFVFIEQVELKSVLGHTRWWANGPRSYRLDDGASVKVGVDGSLRTTAGQPLERT
jgi:hypothetical protein